MSSRRPSKASTSTTAVGGSIVPATGLPANPVSSLWSSYNRATPPRHKIIDAFLVFYIVAGVITFAHGMLITTFPFESWIAAFASTAGQFVLLASLRIQTTPSNYQDFHKSITPQRAFIDFLFASVVLHFFVLNYLQ